MASFIQTQSLVRAPCAHFVKSPHSGVSSQSEETLNPLSSTHPRDPAAGVSSPSEETLVAENYPGRSLSATVALTILLTLCASLDHLAATSFYPALPQVSRDFNVSKSVANLCSSLDFAGVAVTVIYWSAASRQYESKYILLFCLALVETFTMVGGFAPSVGVLISMQILSSAAAAGTVITGVSIINKLWPQQHKGLAMGIFFVGPQASPCLGPVIGGLLTERWGWRALQHFQGAWAAVMFIAVAMFLPKTFEGTAVMGNTEPEKMDKFRARLGTYLRAILHLPQALFRPLRVFTLLKYVFIDVLLWQAAFSFAATSVFLVVLQSVYSSAPYDYSTEELGLLYLPFAVSTIAASLVGGKWSDKTMHRRALARQDQNIEHGEEGVVLLPEDRLGINAWVSFGVLPAALVAFGWALWAQPLWVSPLIPSILIGLGAGMNLGLMTTVLVETIPAQAVGLMAMSSIARNVAAAVGGSVAQPLLDKIGPGWLFTGLSLISLFNLALIAVMQKKGAAWRGKIWHAMAPLARSPHTV